MKRRSPIRRQSKKRAVENRKYLRLREKYLRDNPWCEIGASGCNRKAQHIHHAFGREGKRLLDTRYWFATCFLCHDYIHSHPKIARERGWILT